MKKVIALSTIVLLAGCGTMGIGTNHEVNLYNASEHTVTASGDHGVMNIEPRSSATIHGTRPIKLNTKGKDCAPQVIDTDTNLTALVLDIIPGIIVFWIPYGIDAITGGISNLPEHYVYNCE